MSAFIVVQVAFEIIRTILKAIWDLIVWFYIVLIPFIVAYIGIPLFVLGILMAIAFSAGSLIIMIMFFIVMYVFIKKTVFHNPFPTAVPAAAAGAAS
jgi:hypothetical protein